MNKWKYLVFVLFIYVISFNVLAANTSKDWVWDSSNPQYATALTINDSNYVMGVWCYYEVENSCIYIIDFGTTCEEGSEYPLLINSDAGSSYMKVTCGHKYENRNVMYASDYDVMDDIVKNATKVGFVIPLKGDEFKAVRFSLIGSTYAIEKMLTAFLEKVNQSDNSKRTVNTKRSEEIF